MDFAVEIWLAFRTLDMSSTVFRVGVYEEDKAPLEDKHVNHFWPKQKNESASGDTVYRRDH